MTLSLEKFEDEGYHEIEGLENIASSRDQMEFLKVLSNCQSFIEWLQRETAGNHTIPVTIVYSGSWMFGISSPKISPKIKKKMSDCHDSIG